MLEKKSSYRKKHVVTAGTDYKTCSFVNYAQNRFPFAMVYRVEEIYA